MSGELQFGGLTKPLLALSLHLPWSYAMTALPSGERKEIENRDWPPWRSVSGGQWFLLHAGVKYVADGADYISKVIGRPAPTLAELREAGQVGSLLAFARVRGGFTGVGGGGFPAGQERWFFGPYGWWLEVRPLSVPMKCRGWHKLWNVENQLAKDNPPERVVELLAGLEAERRRLGLAA